MAEVLLSITQNPSCNFCGKRKSEVKKLLAQHAITFDGGQFQACICDECLGTQMVVLAHMDRERFEKLVDVARTFKSETGKPENSN